MYEFAKNKTMLVFKRQCWYVMLKTPQTVGKIGFKRQEIVGLFDFLDLVWWVSNVSVRWYIRL